jgi:hypothetical protein
MSVGNQSAIKHRSAAWSSAAETEAPVFAESSTRLKPAASDAEIEEAIQASLSAALADLDNLELFAPEAVAPKRSPKVMPRIPRGMPPLPHGRLIPPLPVSRLSLVPRLIATLRPKAAIRTSPEPGLELATRAAKVPVAARPPRWPGVVLALLTIGLLGAGLCWAFR